MHSLTGGVAGYFEAWREKNANRKVTDLSISQISNYDIREFGGL